jgi:hypothetical protein
MRTGPTIVLVAFVLAICNAPAFVIEGLTAGERVGLAAAVTATVAITTAAILGLVMWTVA